MMNFGEGEAQIVEFSPESPSRPLAQPGFCPRIVHLNLAPLSVGVGEASSTAKFNMSLPATGGLFAFALKTKRARGSDLRARCNSERKCCCVEPRRIAPEAGNSTHPAVERRVGH